MNIITSTIAYGAVEIIVESFGWGLFGYIFFRFLGVQEKYWYFDYLIVCLVFILWDVWSSAYMMKLDISIGNQEVLTFLDHDVKSLFETDYLDAIFDALEIFIGYMLGKFMLKKLRQHQTMQDG